MTPLEAGDLLAKWERGVRRLSDAELGHLIRAYRDDESELLGALTLVVMTDPPTLGDLDDLVTAACECVGMDPDDPDRRYRGPVRDWAHSFEADNGARQSWPQ